MKENKEILDKLVEEGVKLEGCYLNLNNGFSYEVIDYRYSKIYSFNSDKTNVFLNDVKEMKTIIAVYDKVGKILYPAASICL